MYLYIHIKPYKSNVTSINSNEYILNNIHCKIQNHKGKRNHGKGFPEVFK